MLYSEKMKRVIIFSILFIFSFNFAYAQIVPCGPGPSQPDCTLCHFFMMLGNIISFINIVAFSLGILMLTIGGMLLMMAYINPGAEGLQRAKETFKAVAVGLFIIYGGWLIVDLFFRVVTGNANWYIINC